MSDDEYTRQTQSTCYNTESSYNEMTVLLFHGNAEYCHFFVTSILVKHRVHVIT